MRSFFLPLLAAALTLPLTTARPLPTVDVASPADPGVLALLWVKVAPAEEIEEEEDLELLRGFAEMYDGHHGWGYSEKLEGRETVLAKRYR